MRDLSLYECFQKLQIKAKLSDSSEDIAFYSSIKSHLLELKKIKQLYGCQTNNSVLYAEMNNITTKEAYNILKYKK